VLIEALLALALAGRPSDATLAQRMLVAQRDLPGSLQAGFSTSLGACARRTVHPTGEAYGAILLFGRSEVVSAASVYAHAAQARGALARTVGGLRSPCLADEIGSQYRKAGRRFAAGTTDVARLAPGTTRVRLHFVLRDKSGHTGEGVYDVLLLQRGRSLVGIVVVNPIDDRWERALAAKVARRLV
jgi:hypothetical protein